VPRLILVISDLYPVRQQLVGMPRLGRLEQWLARGRAERVEEGWQQWLLEELFAGRYASMPWAEVASAAIGSGAGHPWLATPVHLVAGIDTLRLHPAGLLHLDAGERQALASDFAKVFHGAGWKLQVSTQRDLLLISESRKWGRSSDPARWLGADPAPGLISGAESVALRRLGSELEMWLHEHPVNRARSAMGLLTVSGLWLWGGPGLQEPPEPRARALAHRGAPAGRVAPASGAAPSAPLNFYGADLFLEGLCRLAGASTQALPIAGGADAIVHRVLGGAPDREALLALERDWFAPLVQQLYRGEWDSLTLLVGEQAVTLRRSGWRVFSSLARTRPWWESLLG
jgi:hypothetical protein